MPMALEEPYGVVLLQIVVLVKSHLSTKVTSIGTKRMPMALEEPYGVVLLQTVVLVKSHLSTKVTSRGTREMPMRKFIKVFVSSVMSATCRAHKRMPSNYTRKDFILMLTTSLKCLSAIMSC